MNGGDTVSIDSAPEIAESGILHGDVAELVSIDNGTIAPHERTRIDSLAALADLLFACLHSEPLFQRDAMALGPMADFPQPVPASDLESTVHAASAPTPVIGKSAPGEP